VTETARKARREIIEQADTLDDDEKLQPIMHLAQSVRRSAPADRAGRDWLELLGAAPYPLLGEDAQAWVSRTRRESDEAREQAVRRRP
jgi:hypothetical protein